jgi:hypothetical protein
MIHPETFYQIYPIIKEHKKKARVLCFPRCLQLVLDTLQGPTYHSEKFAGKGTDYDASG